MIKARCPFKRTTPCVLENTIRMPILEFDEAEGLTTGIAHNNISSEVTNQG